MRIVISSGHGKYVAGAVGLISEVEQARRVVDRVAEYLKLLGVEVETYADDVSTTQSENLERIVDYHNSQLQPHDYDVSVHFNAYTAPEYTDEPMGVEVLYITQAELASNLSNAISTFTGLKNRGAKKRSDLYFLSHTEAKSVLLECLFVDSYPDVALYDEHFDRLCRAVAVTLSGRHFPDKDGIPDNQQNIIASVFGGAADYNVSAYDEDKVLNDTDYYVALPYRFEGERPNVQLWNRETGETATASIEDVGPWNISDPYPDMGTRPQAESGTDMTGRETNGAGIDLSPALARALGVDGMGLVDWVFA